MMDEFLFNYGILGIIFGGLTYAAIWLFRQLGPRFVAFLDAQIAMTNSIQTSTLNTTGALSSIDRSLQELTKRMREREEEENAFRQTSMERLGTMEHTVAMLVVASQQQDGVRCGSSECPAMQLLQRPASARTRKSDYGTTNTVEPPREPPEESKTAS